MSEWRNFDDVTRTWLSHLDTARLLDLPAAVGLLRVAVVGQAVAILALHLAQHSAVRLGAEGVVAVKALGHVKGN